MESLEDFLIEAAREEREREVIVSQRLKKRAFKIRAMTSEEHKRYTRLCYVQRNGNREMDEIKFMEMLVINCVIEPNFRSVDLMGKLNVGTAEELMRAVLLPGEIISLGSKILNFSGFGSNEVEEEAYEEAKKP